MSQARLIAPARDSILGAVETIGDAWSWLILREAVLHRAERFGEFQQRLGISRATLTGRLGQLERGGVLVRDPSTPRRYQLTPAGEDFFGCLMVAQRWGDVWRPTPAAALSATHLGCGRAVSAVLRCQGCGELLRAHEVHAERRAEWIPAGANDTRRRTPDLELLERVRPCSIAYTKTVTGDWWSALIVREMFFGVHRFDELVRRLSQLAIADPPLRLATHPVTQRLIEEPSPIDDAAYKHREDLIDAVLCAWTAAFWARHGLGRCQVLGPTATAEGRPAATIIVPARPEQRR